MTFRPLLNGIQFIFDTTELYDGIPTDILHEARLKYAAAVLLLSQSDDYQTVIGLLDLAISIVPDFLDAYCLREEVWHKYLTEYRGTVRQGTTYTEYRDSDAWQTKRDHVLERDKHKCVVCSDHAQHIHHRTYDNIGKEPLSDLVSLCRECHHKVHEDNPFHHQPETTGKPKLSQPPPTNKPKAAIEAEKKFDDVF